MTLVVENKKGMACRVLSLVGRFLRSRLCGWACLALAASLFGLNLIGMFIPLRNPDIYTEPRNFYSNDITLTAEQFWKLAGRQPDEAATNYVIRLTETVSQGLAHLHTGDRDIQKKYHWRIPIWENYLLWASRHAHFAIRYIFGDITQGDSSYRYIFTSPGKIVERGVGLCVQHCFLETSLLQNQGIPAHMVGFSQHTMVTAEVSPGVWWVLDPDLGVVVPLDIDGVRANPDMVGEIYLAKGHGKFWNSELVTMLREPKYVVTPSAKAAVGTARYYFEGISYWMIWVIPICLSLLGLFCLKRAQREIAKPA